MSADNGYPVDNEGDDAPSPHIGTLNEAPLHAALKDYCAEPGATFEQRLDGFVIDIVQPDGTLTEIQTRSFGSMRRKLHRLTGAGHTVRLVHPIAREKWIVKQPKENGGHAVRRKSPKRGAMTHVFMELVSFPRLMLHPNFSLQVMLIQEEESRIFDGNKSWRRKGWAVEQRRLLTVVESAVFESPTDLLTLIPPTLDDPFTTAALAKALKQPRRIAQQMCYCLHQMDALERVGKQGNAYLYRSTNPQEAS